MSANSTLAGRRNLRWRAMEPPIPHEHGARVILYAPLVIGLVTGARVALVPALLLFAAVSGVFLMRDAASLLARRRGNAGTVSWLAVYTVLSTAAAIPLFVFYNSMAVAPVVFVAAALFLIQSLLIIWPARKRLDRSQWGEVLGVAALTLTGPAGYAVSHDHVDWKAWLLWVCCALFFSSSVFFVKMLLSAAKIRRAVSSGDRLQLGRDNLLYHLLLFVLVVLGASRIGELPGILLILAFAPVVFRAFYGWVRLCNRLPSLRLAGILEALYSLWFAGLLVAVMRLID